MRRPILTSTSVLALALVTAACGSRDTDSGANARTPAGNSAPAGTAGTRTFALADFTSVELAGPDNVIVRYGDAFAVSAAGPQETLDLLEILVENGRLKVRRERGGALSWRDDEPAATITVTLPALTGLSLAGSGTMTADRLTGPSGALSVAGSGDLNVTGLAVEELDVNIAGSGDIAVTGTSRAVDVSIAGSGNVVGAALSAQTADISVAGSGAVALTVTGAADVSTIGSGDVTITGGATCTNSSMGSGTVTCS